MDEDLYDLTFDFWLKDRGTTRPQSGNVFGEVRHGLFVNCLCFDGHGLPTRTAGSVLLLEDQTGRGHNTRVIGKEAYCGALMPYPA